MGYSRKSLQLLGGGYNALVSVDKVPITDYLLAQNFRTDTLGNLAARPGYASIFSIAGAGIAHSSSSGGGMGSPLYVGCNSDVVAPITSAVYYNGDPTPIATGFDGNRIGFASQNGFMYIMNRGNQLRHSAAGGVEAWTLAAPPASPTAAANPSTPVPVATVTFVYTLQGDTAYVHYLTISGTTYSVTENGYSADDIPLVLSLIAASDPNCAVTYAGSGPDLVITATAPNTLVVVSGSDGNATTNLAVAAGAVTSLPNGTYQYFVTFESADLTLESNNSPVSAAAVTVDAQSIVVTIPAADAPTDARVGFLNIYRSGGTLLSIYRVGQIASTIAAPATTFIDSMSDLDATNNGIVMPTQNDPPPAASGIIGPFYSLLYSWSTAANKNRLFWTNANQPQYWPGSADPQVGNWVDVGSDDEAIVWCSIHTNLLIIYKERSIWMIIGSNPSTDTLECVYDGLGLAGQFALAPAGQVDYFVGPNGLCLFDMSEVHAITANVLPLFNQNIVNAGPRTPPGSVLPGSAFNSNSTSPYAIAMGHALGRLYIAYAENGTGNWNLLVQDEGPEPETQAFIARRPGRWFYHRNAVANTLGFFGFYFDGVSMIGLTGAPGEAAQGLSLSDFRGFLTADPGPVGIECVYQSHYEDCGLPDNDKMYLEVAIDYEIDEGIAGGGASVYVYFNNGNIDYPTYLGLLPVAPRGTVSFPLALGESELPESMDGGFLARNCSIVIDFTTSGQATFHNLYLYYYAEERLALVASTIPTDLGVGKVKECKELQLDINAYGVVDVAVLSDLPGNALATRVTPSVAVSTGRAILKFPFATYQGLLWQVVLAGGPFRLYGARLLMRVIGVFVEGYESTAGFLWDSMQIALGGGEVSTLDALRFEMQAQGQCSVQLFTDLPGEASVSHGSYQLTAGLTGRAWVIVPLPPGIEARSVQVQVTGDTGYQIYKAQVRSGHVGRYLAGAMPDGRQDGFNMALEFDFTSERRKMYKRLEIDLRADDTVGMEVITDQDGLAIAAVFSTNLTTPLGRQTLLVALPPGIRGRLLRISLNGANAARIYHIRIWTRLLSDPKAAWDWEDVPLEASDVLPTWQDLISVEETSPVWKLVDVDFAVTES